VGDFVGAVVVRQNLRGSRCQLVVMMQAVETRGGNYAIKRLVNEHPSSSFQSGFA
jgi:hypothetical protein